jgi:multisubunit Na+/H+ antiporter MnhC subunit
MRKIISLNIITIIALVLLFSIACYLLLQDNRLNTSISSIISNAHHLNLKKHLLVLGLLPFYIAAIVFGTAMLGIYLGSIVQKMINRVCMRVHQNTKKEEELGNFPFSM